MLNNVLYRGCTTTPKKLPQPTHLVFFRPFACQTVGTLNSILVAPLCMEWAAPKALAIFLTDLLIYLWLLGASHRGVGAPSKEHEPSEICRRVVTPCLQRTISPLAILQAVQSIQHSAICTTGPVYYSCGTLHEAPNHVQYSPRNSSLSVH